jgi:hypothetical protein
MVDILVSKIVANFFTAWREGAWLVRGLIIFAIALVAAALAVVVLGAAGILATTVVEPLAGGLGASAFLIILGVSAYQESIDQAKREKKIEEAARRVQENPGETQAAWELARVKLEVYVDRNLNQVRSIFWLTAFVMIVGFGLIAYGVARAYGVAANFEASILSAAAGVLVNFIGASFLVIYRSTMTQAKDYVTILERINAVGMAVQILDKIDDREMLLKTETTCALAKQLLNMYTVEREKSEKPAEERGKKAKQK